jgi:hypothetical protein
MLIMCLCLSSCRLIERTPHACVTSGGRFVITEERTSGNTVYVEMYDINTGVMYVYIKLSNSGSISVLYDQDGKPLIYEKWGGE